jgi:TPP-dependent pyruvate/acetoin dehydrogenase alpha subunit
MEHNLWAYSTPVELQFACKDLADRSIGYGVPGFIVDGTDPNQVYDVTYEACQRAYKGEGATLIEAKMMRMKGHAMHDAASYVPKPYFEYWKKRDPISRYENYLRDRGWLNAKQHEELVKDVEDQINKDRDLADASPFPAPEEAGAGVYLDNSVKIPFKYGGPKVKEVKKGAKIGEASNVSHYK